MCLEALSQYLVLAMLLGQPSADTSTPAPPQASQSNLPELYVTRYTSFVIPFEVKTLTEPSRQPVEVQLHVSSDRGEHWQLYDKRPPTPAQQKFLFRTGTDGEYWFVIRTLDRTGRLDPETIARPGLRVQVDARPPTVKLTAQAVGANQVSVGWDIDKQTLKPGSFSIQYRALPKGPWQPVLLNSSAASATNTLNKGETPIWLKPGEGDIQIRAEVADTAGNMAFGHAHIIAGEPSSSKQAVTLAMSQSPALRLGPPSTRTTRTEPAAGSFPSSNADATGSVSININPAIGNRVGDGNESSNPFPSIPGMPPGVRPRMVNSQLFELEYDVDSVGPSGIGRVELWETRDGGQTWQNHRVDNEPRSPLLVTVNEEAIYGFRIAVTNRAGIGGKPPKSGDLPDIWVGVDLTKPSARIVSAQQGVDAEAGHLIITWQADDKALAARPISLSFSQAATGPWLPVASGLENTRRYAWPIDSSTPPQVYLRLEVRDEAGNVGVHTTTDPMAIDLSSPSVRIRDVRSLGHTGMRPAQDPAISR